MNTKISPFSIGYKLPLSKKVIEIPKKHVNKSIAAACTATVQAGTGLAFTALGIASKDPLFAGVGLSIFGIMAGSIAMLKGSIWDFAGKFKEKHNAELIENFKKELNHVNSSKQR